jgi:hypothetical protein
VETPVLLADVVAVLLTVDVKVVVSVVAGVVLAVVVTVVTPVDVADVVCEVLAVDVPVEVSVVTPVEDTDDVSVLEMVVVIVENAVEEPVVEADVVTVEVTVDFTQSANFPDCWSNIAAFKYFTVVLQESFSTVKNPFKVQEIVFLYPFGYL